MQIRGVIFLQDHYGSLGISVDRAANSIAFAADAQRQLNDALRAEAIDQLEDEYREASTNIGELMKTVDKYAARLQSAQDSLQQRAASIKPQGTFSAQAASLLRGNQMEQKMYTTTQEIAKHTKKTAPL